MKRNRIRKVEREQIIRLQTQLDQLRQLLGISERGELIFREDLYHVGDEAVIVEADGLGGALLRVVQGNYPLDYLVRDERSFDTEQAATKAAESLCA